MRFEHALQAARGLGAGTVEKHLADKAVRGLERAKWRLWHGRWPGCQRKLAALCRWTQSKPLRDVAGISLTWPQPAGQFGGWVKLGLGCCQAASLSVSVAPYASSGVRPARVEWGRRTL